MITQYIIKTDKNEFLYQNLELARIAAEEYWNTTGKNVQVIMRENGIDKLDCEFEQ